MLRANLGLCILEGDALLHFHHPCNSGGLHVFGDVAFQLLRRSSRFETVWENTDALELLLGHELLEFLVLGFRFTGEADDERRPHGQLRPGSPQLPEQCFRCSTVHPAYHPLQHPVVDVLEWHIEVRDDLLGCAKELEQVLADVFRVGVQKAYPLQALHLIEFPQEFRQADSAIQIHAVVGRVLCHDDEFAHAVGYQLTGFLQHFFDGLGDVLATHFGDGTVRTEPVAALTDLQVGKVPGGDAEAGGVFKGTYWCGAKDTALLGHLGDGPVHHLDDFLTPENTDDLIDFRHLFQQHFTLAFGHATRHDDRSDPSGFLQRQHLPDDAQRFLPGRFDEPAGVDDHDVRTVGIRLQRITILGQLAEHPFGINEVLRATKAHEGIGTLRYRCFHRGR